MEQNVNQKSKVEENKEQNKKALGKFILIMIASLIFGGVIGFFGCVAIGQYDVVAVSEKIGIFLTVCIGSGMPVVMTVLVLVTIVYGTVVVNKIKKEWTRAQDFEDESFDTWYEKADSKLENALELVSYTTIINYFGFSASFYSFLYYEEQMRFAWIFFLALIVLIITIISSIMLQSRIVDMVKVINPEKSGSVYDMKFQDKWVDSCDEFEQLMTYKACYKVYKVLNFVCTMLWMVFTILALVIKLSLWPVTIISFIWMLMTVTYMIECKKLSKGKRSAKTGAAGNTVSI